MYPLLDRWSINENKIFMCLSCAQQKWNIQKFWFYQNYETCQPWFEWVASRHCASLKARRIHNKVTNLAIAYHPQNLQM